MNTYKIIFAITAFFVYLPLQLSLLQQVQLLLGIGIS